MQVLRVASFLAFKFIVRGQRSTIILMILILSLSFVNLVFIAGILGGITAALNQQLITNLTSNIVVEPQEEPVKKRLIIHQEELRRHIQQIPGVIATSRHYKLPATLAYDKEKNGNLKFASTEVIGIDPDQEKEFTLVARNLLVGRYLEVLGTDEIILGSDLAGGYGSSQESTSLGGVKVGDKVWVTFSNGVERHYRVKGIYKVWFSFVDRLAFITSREAESAFSVYNDASQILVQVDTARLSEDSGVHQIQAIAPNLKVRKWTELMGEFADVTTAFNMITLVVSAVGLAVAAATIFILIYVHAVNKRRQIGILKAIGIKQSIIVCSYVLQSLFYSFCGVAIGSLLIFYVLAPYFSEHPLKLPIGDTSLVLDPMRIIFSILSVLAAASIAGFIPSWRVAKQNILKAIWGV